MEVNESKINERKIFLKSFHQYQIQVKRNLNSIKISVQNNLNLFQLKYNFEYLNKLFIDEKEIESIIELISIIIEHNNIHIQENQNNLKLTLISNFFKKPVELILNKQLPKLKMIKSIKSHKDIISSVSIFPSGNIISVSIDKSIKIYDNKYNILQHIKNAHTDSITYVEIKDENNFITCSDDKYIKTWIKIENKYKINKIIKNAHNDQINKVIYYSNKNLISCSWDNTVKIWEEKDDNYQLIATLNHSDIVWSILFLKDKNILISSGNFGSNLWNFNNFELIKHIKDVKCRLWNSLARIDENRIIIGGYKSLNIISLFKKIKIKEIKIPFDCFGIKIIEDKKIFFVGGESKDILIFRNDNYECIQIIKNAHDSDIGGFVELKNNYICSFSNDNSIKVWSF